MALINYADRVKDTTTTTGLGDVTLSGTAPTGFQSFDTAFGHAGNYFTYCIAAGSEWEVGEGHLSASTTLVRDTVYASSNSGSAVSFSAGTKDVFCTVPARALDNPSSYLASAATFNNTNTLANTDLIVTVAAGGIYDIDLLAHITVAAYGPLLDFAGTSTHTSFIGQWESVNSNAPYVGSDNGNRVTSASTAFEALEGSVSLTIRFRGSVNVDAGGTLILRGCQRVADASDTTILSGSVLKLTRLN